MGNIHYAAFNGKESNLLVVADHVSHVLHSNRTLFESIDHFKKIPYLFVVHKIDATKISVTMQNNHHVDEFHLAPVRVQNVGIKKGERRGVRLYRVLEII